MWLRNTHARVAECTCSRVYTNVRGDLARASQTVQNPLHPKQRDHVISSHRRTPRKPKEQFKGGHRSISDYNHKQLYFCKTPRHNLGRQSKYAATGLATQRHRHAQSMYNATSLDTHKPTHKPQQPPGGPTGAKSGDNCPLWSAQALVCVHRLYHPAPSVCRRGALLHRKMKYH